MQQSVHVVLFMEEVVVGSFGRIEWVAVFDSNVAVGDSIAAAPDSIAAAVGSTIAAPGPIAAASDSTAAAPDSTAAVAGPTAAAVVGRGNIDSIARQLVVSSSRHRTLATHYCSMRRIVASSVVGTAVAGPHVILAHSPLSVYSYDYPFAVSALLGRDLGLVVGQHDIRRVVLCQVSVAV